MSDSHAERDIRLVIVDDHEVVRSALASALDAQPGIEVVGVAGSITSGAATITDLAPDVAVVDLGLPDGSGVELCRQVRASMPTTRCIIHTGTLLPEQASEARDAGVSDVVLKSLSGTELVDAIRRVGSGI